MSSDWDDQAPRDAWEPQAEPEWWQTGGAAPHADDAQAGAGVAPGWYWDPDDQTRQRYWDGHQWTDQRRGGQRLVAYGSALGPGWATLGAVLVVLVGAVGALIAAVGAIVWRRGDTSLIAILDDPIVQRLSQIQSPLALAAGVCWLVWQYQVANSTAVAPGALRKALAGTSGLGSSRS